jgi:ATP-binding cassette subfamily D (ALD) long-chain fatty acid import protein
MVASHEWALVCRILQLLPDDPELSHSGNILKPSLDLLLFTSQLSRSLGVRGTIMLCLNYYGTVAILRAVTPAFGRLAAVEARLEGEYRAGMGRVGREAEEVAFYDGGARERDILTNAYLKLIKHVNYIYKVRHLFLIRLHSLTLR